MAKKENFQEYVTRTQNEIAGIESKIEAEKLKKLQLEHKMQRLQNVTEYKVNKKGGASKTGDVLLAFVMKKRNCFM